jgi:uncharacterized protein YbjT (DUF2867 family)
MRLCVAGGTGLVGGHFLNIIPHKGLTLLTRRAFDPSLSVSSSQCVAEPADWAAIIADLKPDVFVSALGTTIRQAGSKAAFRAVDHALVVELAKAAKDAGARQIIMVSSVGASAGASNFYLKTKGQAEDVVQALGFARVDIMRPGLLRGDRKGPPRIGERFALALSPLTDVLTPRAFDRYRSITAADVAAAMAQCLGATPEGVFVHHNREMLGAARHKG